MKLKSIKLISNNLVINLQPSLKKHQFKYLKFNLILTKNMIVKTMILIIFACLFINLCLFFLQSNSINLIKHNFNMVYTSSYNNFTLFNNDLLCNNMNNNITLSNNNLLCINFYNNHHYNKLTQVLNCEAINFIQNLKYNSITCKQLNNKINNYNYCNLINELSKIKTDTDKFDILSLSNENEQDTEPEDIYPQTDTDKINNFSVSNVNEQEAEPEDIYPPEDINEQLLDFNLYLLIFLSGLPVLILLFIIFLPKIPFATEAVAVKIEPTSRHKPQNINRINRKKEINFESFDDENL